MNRLVVVFLHAVIGIGAIGAGQALALEPSGANLDFSTEWLDGSPFTDYLVPGLFLLLVIAPTNLLSALVQLRRYERAPVASLLTGLILMVWSGVQWVVIGYQSWTQIAWTAAFLLLTLLAALQLGEGVRLEDAPTSGRRLAR